VPLLITGNTIKAETLPWEISKIDSFAGKLRNPSVAAEQQPGLQQPDLKQSAALAEYETIMSVLRQVNFNKTKAAEILKIDRKTLYNKLKSFESAKSTAE